jgi:Vacuolar protein sorting-associated protein 26
VTLSQVNVTLKKPGTKLEHQGIKIELIGEFAKNEKKKKEEKKPQRCRFFLSLPSFGAFSINLNFIHARYQAKLSYSMIVGIIMSF